MDIKVKKRNGRLEDFVVDKINASVQRGCNNIEDVSPSEIVLDAQLQLFDKITTKEITTTPKTINKDGVTPLRSSRDN